MSGLPTRDGVITERGAWAEIRDAKLAAGRGWVLTDASGLMLDLSAKGESRLGKLCEVIGGDGSRVA